MLSFHPDPFLVDRDAVIANIGIDDRRHFVAKLYSFNRDVLLQVEAELQHLVDLAPVLEVLSQKRYRACLGFKESEFSEALPRLKKSDLLSISSGRFSGEMIFRSKFCNFVAEVDFDADVVDERRCNECRQLCVELGLEPHSEKPEQQQPDLDSSELEVERRKRGRPRGSKTKNFVVSVAAGEETDVKDDLLTDAVVKRENVDIEANPADSMPEVFLNSMLRLAEVITCDSSGYG